jgi:colanic acid/amylovoran biosynthesis glycosyltransferase
MRIAYLVSQYPAVNHTFVFREIQQLRSHGFEIHVASIGATEGFENGMTAEERDECTQTYYIKPAGILGAVQAHVRALFTQPGSYLSALCWTFHYASFDLTRILRNLFYFVEAVMVGEWMKRYSLNHVHVHFSSMVGLFVTKLYPFTMSVTVHGPDEFDPTLPTGWCLAEKIEACKFVCAISNYGRSQLMRSCRPAEWTKIEVSRLGVDLSLFSPRPLRKDPSPFRLLCVARLAPVKAQLILLAAFDCVVREGRNVQLRLVGDGRDREALEQEVIRRGLSGKVTFEGWLNQEQVQAAYKEADLFVLASFAEGVPVVLMEAMAVEIPCVATWVAGVPELIRDEVDGLLVPPSDETALAAAIARLVDDPSLRRRLGQEARQHVLREYDLVRNAGHLANIFHERLGEMPSAGATRQDINTHYRPATSMDGSVAGGLR